MVRFFRGIPGLHRAEKEMTDLERMVDQKVQALHERLRGKEEEFQVHNFLKLDIAVLQCSGSSHVNPVFDQNL
jgi:hypothetical protein